MWIFCSERVRKPCAVLRQDSWGHSSSWGRLLHTQTTPPAPTIGGSGEHLTKPSTRMDGLVTGYTLTDFTVDRAQVVMFLIGLDSGLKVTAFWQLRRSPEGNSGFES